MYTPIPDQNRSFVLKPLAAAVLVMCASSIQAAPSFNNSPGNAVSVVSKDSTTTVTQSTTSSNQALANWNDFSVAREESVIFIQPNSSSVILNRVVGSNPSEIFGRLESNGRVFLINPNGIVFGVDSQVNVGGLVASTLDLKNGAKRDNESIELEVTNGAGTGSGSISNSGTINAREIAFISRLIENSGTLNVTGPGAAVHLIAASEVTVNASGNDLVFNVLKGHENALIQQLGSVLAEGGKIVLLARSDAGGPASVINTANVVRATQIQIEGDIVRLGGEMGGQISGSDASNTLQVTAKKIEQNESVSVDGTAHLVADQVELLQAANDFKGQVNLTVSGQTDLRNSKQLRVAGTVNTATIESGTLTLDGLTAEGELTLRAESIQQVGALRAKGQTRLQGGTANLGNSGNDFDGEVDLSLAGAATLRAREDLQLGGTARSVSATAAGSLRVSGLDSQDIALTANQVELQNLAAKGTLELNGGTVTQQGALTVEGETRLAARNVNLQHEANDFKGGVEFSASGKVSLRDANSLRVQGQAESLNLKAGARVEQSSALNIAGTSNIAAENIDLSHAENRFGDSVTVNATQNVNLVAKANLTVGGQANSLTAHAGEILQFQATEVNTLVASGKLVNQVGALVVNSTAQVKGQAVTLMNGQNDFRNRFDLEVAGVAQVQDRNNLLIAGKAQTLNATAADTLSLGDLQVESGNFSASTIELNQLRVENEAFLQATLLTQTQATQSAGLLNIAADTVTLDALGNDFQGELKLDGVATASIRDENNLRIGGQAGVLTVTAQDTLTFTGNTLGALNATAEQINQTGVLKVLGQTELVAKGLTLQNAENDFVGVVNLQVAGTSRLKDTNNLTVQGELGNSALAADNILTLNALRAGQLELAADRLEQTAALAVKGELILNAANSKLNLDSNSFEGDVVLLRGHNTLHTQGDLRVQGSAEQLSAVAKTIAQSGALAVSGPTALKADSLELTNSGNDFQGGLELTVAGQAQVLDRNDLSISGNVQNLNTEAKGILQLQGLNAESINAAAAQIQLDQLVVRNGSNLNANHIGQNSEIKLGGTARLQADTVVLNNKGNDFSGPVNLNTRQAADIHDANTLTLGSVTGAGELKLTASVLEQSGAINHSGNVHVQAEAVTLTHTANNFSGSLGVTSGKAHVVGSNKLNMTFEGGDLTVQAEALQLAAQVQGNLNVKADSTVLGNTRVQGATTLDVAGELSQNQALAFNNANIKAGKITLGYGGNQFGGTTRLQSNNLMEVGAGSKVNLETGSSTGSLALSVQGDAVVSGEQLVFANSRVDGNLDATARQISQAGGLNVQGNATFTAVGGAIDLQHTLNSFGQAVNLSAEQTNLFAQGDLRLKNLVSRGGEITAQGRLILQGRIEQTGGTLSFRAKGTPAALSSADIALLLPPELDVYSTKEAVDPVSGLGRITLASAEIHQESGEILTAAGALTRFNSTKNGSVVLAKNNQINGHVAALSGQEYMQPYAYQPAQGASLFAVNNEAQLRVAGKGIESDVVAIQSRGLATVGSESLIRARMPYNDNAAGSLRSYAGLALFIPSGNSQAGATGPASFGEPLGVGQQAGAGGAIRVEVGDVERAGLGGFVTVLPFKANNVLPGQVVYLSGPEPKGNYAFFYDGARNMDRIPVVYNGSSLLSPQENAALTTAQGAVVLARQEQTRSVVRTENVAGKVINGVVAEVGPGRPATEGEGGAAKPESCDVAGEGLACSP